MSIIEDRSPSFIKDDDGRWKWTTIAILLFTEAVCATIGIFIARYITTGDTINSLILALISAIIIVSIDIISLVLTGKPLLSYILQKKAVGPRM